MKFITICVGTIYCILLACSKKDKDPAPGGNPPVTTIEADVSIAANENKQVIQGFGCASVFVPPNTSAYTSDEFDRLFGSGSGQIGLDILRIRIASDDAWRATELNYAKAAIQRGAKILASPWSPPANMKTNNNIIGGSLKPDSGAAYAKYLNDFAKYMSDNGAPVYAVSVQNEPDWNATYESCVWTATEMRDFLKNHGHLVTNAKLMAPELVNYNTNYINTVLGDATAAANLDLLGTHIYGGGLAENTTVTNSGKEIWMTEHLDTNINHIANLNTAVEIHDCFTKANFNAYIYWYGKRFYGPIGQDGAVTKRGFMIAQFARFIPPGSTRLGAGTVSKPDIFISAYKTSAGKKIIVAINRNAAVVKQTITVNNGTIAEVIPYTTTDNTNVVAGNKITISNNKFTYELPSLSVTTFVEQ